MAAKEYRIYFPDTGQSAHWNLEECLQVIGRDSMSDALRGYGVNTDGIRIPVVDPMDPINHPACAECETWVLPDVVLDFDGCAPCCAYHPVFLTGKDRR